MKNVLIFEDDMVIQSGINQLVVKTFFDQGQIVNIFNCASKEEVLEVIKKNHIHLFLLDIAIPDNPRAGIELGIDIVSQEIYRDTPIIYITANPNTVFEAINKTHCYKFLEKPFYESDLLDAIIDVMKTKSTKPEDMIEIESMGKKYCICKKDILYIESFGHDISIWLRNDVILIKHIALRNILKKLDEPFVQCHKSFIVNLNYVKIIDKPKNEVVLAPDGKCLPIGRVFKKDL